MKKELLQFPLIFLFLISFTACEGGMGPEGPPGAEELPTSFEFEAELLAGNQFEFCHDIPGQIEVFDSDVILAYVLEDFIEDDNLDVWRQLPITEFNDRGTRLLDFDYTAVDVCTFVVANYRLDSSDEFDGILIRAVHVPAVFMSEKQAVSIKNAESFQELETLLEMEIQTMYSPRRKF
ncbi:MAG: hypothetical protein WEB89_03270 [Balneolales bacterium]